MITVGVRARLIIMADMGNEGYRTMVCVETTNAASDRVTVGPGESCTLAARYTVLPL